MAHLNLAPIGNCAVASLVDPQARHVWFCFPRLDGNPVFSALVNGSEPDSGFMDVLLDGYQESDQHYRGNTAVLETTLRATNGEAVRVVDFAPRFAQFGRSFRPPMLVRRLEPAAGQPRITIRIRPTFGYGAVAPQISIGSNHARFTGGDGTLRVTADIGPSYYLNESAFLLDRPINLFIGPDESLSEAPDGLAQRFLHDTVDYWTEWTRQLAIPFDWQSAVIRAAITLKLCTFEETGAIVAALTTSVPEAPGTVRNWDYRHCWLRDAYFTVSALNRLNATRTMENFVRFLLDTVVREHGHPLHPVYPIVANTDLTEREAQSLVGYRGMGPVRIGNAAALQRQNDVYGSVVLASAQLFWDLRIPTIGGANLYRRLRILGQTAVANAMTPDSGLWEYRGRNGVFTYSASMCWAAAHRLALVAQRIGAADEAAQWHEAASILHQKIMQRAVTRNGWISGVLDAAVADASVLLLPQLGLLSATDERFLATVKMIEARLIKHGFIMRYDEVDDFGMPETAFLVCTYWYIDALAATERKTEARALFEHLLERRNSAGLFSEDIEPASGELWGNFPQTYSLVGLALTAHRLSRSWEQGLCKE